MPKLRMLGVLLCYNDGDMLPDAIEYLLENNHDLVVWNHGSTDDTADVLASYRSELREVSLISRSVDFYDMYPLMSKHLIQNYISSYDWISWPDQDEILEGPARDKPYWEYLEEVAASRHSWIEFNDLVYWYTREDDQSIASPTERVRHYSLAKHGPKKIRSWRASSTNIRWFNHNRTNGSRYPRLFHLRHYPMRSEEQMKRRIGVDRAGIQHGPVNFHYENMKTTLNRMEVRAGDLHWDDGRSELDTSMKFTWGDVYGSSPAMPPDVLLSYLLSTKRWEIAETVRHSLEEVPAETKIRMGEERVRKWLVELQDKIGDVVTITFEGERNAKIISEDTARSWSAGSSQQPELPSPIRSLNVQLGRCSVRVHADALSRSIRVAVDSGGRHGSTVGPALVALVPSHGGDETRIANLGDGAAEFDDLKTMYYFLTTDGCGDSSEVSTSNG